MAAWSMLFNAYHWLLLILICRNECTSYVFLEPCQWCTQAERWERTETGVHEGQRCCWGTFDHHYESCGMYALQRLLLPSSDPWCSLYQLTAEPISYTTHSGNLTCGLSLSRLPILSWSWWIYDSSCSHLCFRSNLLLCILLHIGVFAVPHHWGTSLD